MCLIGTPILLAPEIFVCARVGVCVYKTPLVNNISSSFPLVTKQNIKGCSQIENGGTPPRTYFSIQYLTSSLMKSEIHA